MKVAGLFPGQGSQSIGMAKEFFDSSNEAKKLFAQADEVLGYSISKLCFEGPLEELTLTKNAQPAILVSSYVAYTLAKTSIDVAAGHSLGEYTALVAAGVLDFADAVKVVNNRGTYMQEAVAPGAGKMVAVMGPNENEISEIIKTVDSGIAEIANLNCPGQTVVAGDAAGVDAFSEKMAQAGGKIIPLNVSAPFHCSLMKPAAEKLASDLDNIKFNDATFPVYVNVSAKPITSGNDARQALKDQVCGSVRWTDSVQAMIADGVDTCVEFGQGAVLSKLMKRIDKSIPCHSIANPESLEKVKASL